MFNLSRRAGQCRRPAIGGLLGAVAFAVMAQTASATTPAYSLSAFAGTGTAGAPAAGAATSSHLRGPYGVAVDSAGDVYIADSGNNEVEKVTPSGTLSIIAGNGTAGTPTPGVATNSDLNEPAGVAVDSSGNVYITNYAAYDVVKVTPAGVLSIIAGNGTDAAPVAGAATSSPMGEVWGVAVDSSGNVYVADSTEEVIEKITPSGTLSIFAGVVGQRGTPTPGPATSSHFHGPTGIALDAASNLYVADYGNARIEKITPSGTLSVFAGNGSFAAPTPGPATSSALDYPFGVAVDAAGDVYIADTQNNEIEEVMPEGTLSVIAGNHTQGAPTYGVAATGSDLYAPEDVASTAAGRLYVADTSYNTVDLLAPLSPTASAAPTVTGTTAVGQTLTASTGTFTNSPITYAYQWEDCDSTGANCTSIAGATSSTYTLVASDAGHTIRVIVTASNSGGSTTSTSAPTAAVTAATTATLLVSAPPSNAFTVGAVSVQSNGTITLTLTVPGPGEVNVLGTHVEVEGGAKTAALLKPGYRRLDWGRVTVRTDEAGRVTILLHPNRAGRQLIARHRRYGWALHLRVWTAYTPAGGAPREIERVVTVLRARRRG